MPRIAIRPDTSSIVTLRVSLDDPQPRITDALVPHPQDQALGWSSLYARLWAHGELELAGDPDLDEVETWVRRQFELLEQAFPGIHPDLMTERDLAGAMWTLGVTLRSGLEWLAVVQRVLDRLGETDLGDSGSGYADRYFTQARGADGSFRGWWRPADWDAAPLAAAAAKPALPASIVSWEELESLVRSSPAVETAATAALVLGVATLGADPSDLIVVPLAFLGVWAAEWVLHHLYLISADEVEKRIQDKLGGRELGALGSDELGRLHGDLAATLEAMRKSEQRSGGPGDPDGWDRIKNKLKEWQQRILSELRRRNYVR